MLRKNCVFFTIHCNPSLAYKALRDLQSSQRKVSVQSLILAGNFLYKQPSAGEGEGANFREFLENENHVYDFNTGIRLCNLTLLFLLGLLLDSLEARL